MNVLHGIMKRRVPAFALEHMRRNGENGKVGNCFCGRSPQEFMPVPDGYLVVRITTRNGKCEVSLNVVLNSPGSSVERTGRKGMKEAENFS